MRVAAGVVLDWLEANPNATAEEREAMIAHVPAWQQRLWPELNAFRIPAPRPGAGG